MSDTALEAPTEEQEQVASTAQGPASGGAAPAGPETDAPAPVDKPSIRTAVAVSFPVLAAAIAVGGVFDGISPRFYAVAAGLLGVALGVGVQRLGRKPLLTYLAIFGGIFLIGVLLLLPDVGAIAGLTDTIKDATKDSKVLRPPAPFTAGWLLIQSWLMAIAGFSAAWVANVLKLRAAALLVPLPVAVFAAISVPDEQQVITGIAAFVLFAIGLGLIASEQAAGDDEEHKPSVAYEIRKAIKALPVLIGIGVLLFVLSTTDFLFPDPVYDPTQLPQQPKAQPLKDSPDRVLFEVESALDGPFPMGRLDVYFEKDSTWRLPPFAQGKVEPIPGNGIVDEELEQKLSASFTVRGLTGPVLPGLPNITGVAATGPKLGYDSRSNVVRLVNGQSESGFEYDMTAGGLPSVEDLKLVAIDLDGAHEDVAQFTEIPDMPPAVAGLVNQAPDGSKWEQFDFLRTWILDNVTASGTGTPVPISPERVADMISGSKEGSPFEIVAAQAMLARWVGVPSRIAYGFDGGERVNNILQVRPRNGASFVEVYFPGFKWLPVIGTPKKAEPSVSSDPNLQQLDPNIVPSNEVEAQIFLPVVVPPGSVLAKQIALGVLFAVLAALAIFLAWLIYPAIRKAQVRSRRRNLARSLGPAARIALAYAEWRDYSADLGYSHPTDTPLMFLDRFVDDEEHRELAWLTTRVLWGDLRGSEDPELASIAEELSRSLRRRLASIQPASLRAVALVSRISLREPYGGGDFLPTGRGARRAAKASAMLDHAADGGGAGGARPEERVLVGAGRGSKED